MLIQKYRRQYISVALLADRFLPGLQHLGIASGQQPQLSWAQQPPSDHCWTEHSLEKQQGPVWWQGIQHSSDLQQLWQGQRLRGREDTSSDRRVVTSYSVNWGLISNQSVEGQTKNRLMSLISRRQVWIISILCRVEDAFKPLIFFSFMRKICVERFPPLTLCEVFCLWNMKKTHGCSHTSFSWKHRTVVSWGAKR